MKLEFHLTMTAAPLEATVVVVENAVVEIEKYQIWGDMYDYALTMTGECVNPEDGLTYPVLVEIPVYYPEATEPSEIMSTVTVGGMGDDDPWLGFGEGTLTVTTVDGVVTATGIVQNPMAGVAIDITISGKLPKEPTAIEDVEVEVKAVKVIKNAYLAKVAAEKGWEGIEPVLTGPTAMVTGAGDPAEVAKIIVEFLKKNENASVKAAQLDTATLDQAQVEALSKLPSKDVMRAMFLGTLQAPASSLVRVFAAPLQSVLYVLKAKQDKDGSAA
jgi:large subunit ribosomal protein L10